MDIGVQVAVGAGKELKVAGGLDIGADRKEPFVFNRPQEHVLAWPLDTMGPFYEEWRVLLAAADLPDEAHYTPKDFRSMCGSALIASNVPTVVVKDFLGTPR